MLRRLSLALIIAGSMIANPALAIGETRLKPVTPWHVDWTKTSCTLARGFGDKDDPQLIFFEQFSQAQGFQLLLVAKALRGIEQSDRPMLSYTVGDSGVGYGEKLPRALLGRNSKRVPTLFVPQSDLFGDVPGDARTIEGSITQVRVQARGRTIVFETGPLDKPFDAMRTCTDHLIKQWGLDPEKMRRLSRWSVPKSAPGMWVRSSDYPIGSLYAGEQALIAFRLLIDDTGMPTDCLIQRSYADEVFNRVTCQKIMQRARFDPALDEEGKPVASYFASSVSWVIER
jgi:hypothetical protein